ncbi:MAG: PH domain-containing protein [Acidobacteriota bacterium]|nr:PH domain-containing protein [Acidobacteriota bacterium]MDH3523042.1 PH domain-containing protein [Acidobacteriota bacterium]
MASRQGGRRFECSTRGAIAAGRRRLARLLLGLSLAMSATAVPVWIADRKLPALLCLAVAFVLWTTWRMSGDLDVLWLEVDAETLVVQMRRRRLRLPLLAPRARRLTAEERDHTARLASNGMLVAGTGGFDSHLLGEFNLHASDLANAVLVETGDSRVVVTPDDPAAFLAALDGRTAPGAGALYSPPR